MVGLIRQLKGARDTLDFEGLGHGGEKRSHDSERKGRQ
jgi:hypothetical protein